ncbi:MAG: hypothetical protein JOZ99_15120 [Actinobacteria bacterium]|nr:hypothetical protein [Actinomycetota bacterium]
MTAAVLVLAANAYAVLDLVATHAQTSRLHHDTLAAEQQIAADGQRVASENTGVGAAAQQLAARTDDRDRMRAQVVSASADVSAARVDLGAAFGRLALQVGEITTLSTCMQSVSQAMNGLSVGDTTRGLDALHSVQTSCDTAASIGSGG